MCENRSKFYPDAWMINGCGPDGQLSICLPKSTLPITHLLFYKVHTGKNY